LKEHPYRQVQLYFHSDLIQMVPGCPTVYGKNSAQEAAGTAQTVGFDVARPAATQKLERTVEARHPLN
jgi:hypothetical protein